MTPSLPRAGNPGKKEKAEGKIKKPPATKSGEAGILPRFGGWQLFLAPSSLIRNSNGSDQHLVASDNRRQVPFALGVFEQADAPRLEIALAPVACANSCLSGEDEHPLSGGRAVPATDPIRSESQEVPPISPAHGRNIERWCGRCKSFRLERNGRSFNVRLACVVRKQADVFNRLIHSELRENRGRE